MRNISTFRLFRLFDDHETHFAHRGHAQVKKVEKSKCFVFLTSWGRKCRKSRKVEMFRIFRLHGAGKVEKVEKSKCFALFDFMGPAKSKKSKSRNVSHFSTSWGRQCRKSRKVEMFRICRLHGAGKVEKVEKSKCFAFLDIIGPAMSKKSKSRNVSHLSTSWGGQNRKSRKVEMFRTFRQHWAGILERVEKSKRFALFNITGLVKSNSKSLNFSHFSAP